MTARNLWDCEPVALAEALRQALNNTLILAVLFGAPLTAEQIAGILACSGSVWAVLQIVVRNKVSPMPASLEPPLKELLRNDAEGRNL